MNRAIVTFGILTVAVACASSGSGSSTSGSTAAAPARPSYRANVITAAEIAEQRFRIHNGVQAVMILRPNWPRITVYLDSRMFGLFEKLQEIPSDTIREIRLLSVQESRVRIGPDAQPAIWVTRK